jgi:hypothetical protein
MAVAATIDHVHPPRHIYSAEFVIWIGRCRYQLDFTSTESGLVTSNVEGEGGGITTVKLKAIFNLLSAQFPERFMFELCNGIQLGGNSAILLLSRGGEEASYTFQISVWTEGMGFYPPTCYRLHRTLSGVQIDINGREGGRWSCISERHRNAIKLVADKLSIQIRRIF